MPGRAEAALRRDRQAPRGAQGHGVDGEPPYSLSAFSVAAATAFIPLVARARARSLFPELGFADEEAERMVAALGLAVDRFGAGRAWMRGVVLRARWFDDRCRRFFAASPDGLGIALGAGFDTRFRRLGDGAGRWVDLDLAQVIALKRRFVKPTRRYRMLACDVTDAAWMDRVGWRPGMPVLLTAEGLLMYLEPPDVRRLFRAIAARFSKGGAPAAFLFDYASPLAVFNSWLHPALRYTTARFRWGLAGADAACRIDRRFHVVEDRDVSRECGYSAALAASLHRFMTMGRFLHGLAHLRLEGG